MAIPIKRAQRPASERELIKLGESSGGDIPTEYREFLSRNNGAVPETNGFQISKTGNSSGVNEFLSVETVLREKERLGIRLAKEAYPIAHAEGGNLVCIMLGGQWNGKIFFWDHELEDESEFPSSTNMFELAPSFNAFWNSLKPLDPNSIELQPGQVKRAWIDPDFLKSLRSDE